MTNPYAAPDGRQGSVRGWVVAVGIVAGLAASFVWLVAVFITAVSRENRPDRMPEAAVFGLLVLPLVVAVVLLGLRRTRQAAGGLVMGTAIGAIALDCLLALFVAANAGL